MGSFFSWLDSSEAQRRQMLEIVDLFRERGTLDELGFGSIRDSFADLFFPGTSTIQTRARYLLFVPWVHRAIEREGLPYPQVDRRARHIQAQLARALQRGGQGDAQGVIGIQAGEALLRTPASIYWAALRRFGIWRFAGSLAQYYSAIGCVGAAHGPIRSDDGELVEGMRIVGWHPGLPNEPVGLLESVTFELSHEEANYLRERISAQAPASLLVLCLGGSRNIRRVDVPWQHPDVPSFPERLRQELDHARRFSVVAHGVMLLYHLMLAEKAVEIGLPVEAGLIERRRSEIEAWADDARTQGDLLRRWRMSDLWSVVMGNGHRITPTTRRFVENVVAIALDDPRALVDHHGARRLVEQRELVLKAGLARLTHRRALERFSASTNPAPLTYRWPNVRTILSDIHRGLGRSPGALDVPVA
jgi:hypothetical protein